MPPYFELKAAKKREAWLSACRDFGHLHSARAERQGEVIKAETTCLMSPKAWTNGGMGLQKPGSLALNREGREAMYFKGARSDLRHGGCALHYP